MSHPVLLVVCGLYFAGACWLTHSLVAAHTPAPQPGVEAPPAPPTELPESPDCIPPEPPHIAVETPAASRPFGQEQLAGPPDSPDGGDVATSWAPASADGQNEWIELHYAEAVQPIAVLVFETASPGALSQIEFYDASGAARTVWGDDPKPVNAPLRVVNAPVEVDFTTQRVRLSILSTLIPGWNEIDAVGLLDQTGRIHWAVAARASSSYAGDSSELLPARSR